MNTPFKKPSYASGEMQDVSHTCRTYPKKKGDANYNSYIKAQKFLALPPSFIILFLNYSIFFIIFLLWLPFSFYTFIPSRSVDDR